MTGMDDTRQMTADELQEARKGRHAYKPEPREGPAYNVMLIETPSFEDVEIMSEEGGIRPEVYVLGDRDGYLDPIGLTDEINGNAVKRDSPHPETARSEYGMELEGGEEMSTEDIIKMMRSNRKARAPFRSRRNTLVLYDNSPWSEGKYVVFSGDDAYNCVTFRARNRDHAEAAVKAWHKYVSGKRVEALTAGGEEAEAVCRGSPVREWKAKRQLQMQPKEPAYKPKPAPPAPAKQPARRASPRTMGSARARVVASPEELPLAGKRPESMTDEERRKRALLHGDDSDIAKFNTNSDERKKDFYSYMDKFRPKK